jgi:hypothetical protein
MRMSHRHIIHMLDESVEKVKEVTSYIEYKLFSEKFSQGLSGLSLSDGYRGMASMWRIEQVVKPFWEQVLLVELTANAEKWNTRLSYQFSNFQPDTQRCFVTFMFHWEQPFEVVEGFEVADEPMSLGF